MGKRSVLTGPFVAYDSHRQTRWHGTQKVRIIRARACRTMVLGHIDGSASRASFNLNTSSAARTRSQWGPSENLVIGRGRFLDAIMLLAIAGFSFTNEKQQVRRDGPCDNILLGRTFAPINASKAVLVNQPHDSALVTIAYLKISYTQIESSPNFCCISSNRVVSERSALQAVLMLAHLDRWSYRMQYVLFSIVIKIKQAYRRSPTVETSNLSAIACPSLPPKNLI
jgi:hypothetical protein